MKIITRSIICIAALLLLNVPQYAQEQSELPIREQIALLSEGSAEDMERAAHLKKELLGKLVREREKTKETSRYYVQMLRECVKMYDSSDFKGAFDLASSVVKRLEADKEHFKGPRQQLNYERMRARLYERFLYDVDKAEQCYANAASLYPKNEYITRRLTKIENRKNYAEEKLKVRENEEFRREVMMEDLIRLRNTGEISDEKYAELLEQLESPQQ